MELRTTAADEGFLSPNFERDSAVISVSGAPGTDCWPFVHAIDETLRPFAARPHWGKLHFMTRERLEELFPRFDRFVELRRELDPDGVFLNDHSSSSKDSYTETGGWEGGSSGPAAGC
jgi:FAD/FMN-containing dehydrogenase